MSYIDFADAAAAQLIESATPSSFPAEVKKTGNKLEAKISGSPKDLANILSKIGLGDIPMKEKISFDQSFTFALVGDMKGKSISFSSWTISTTVTFEGIVADMKFSYDSSQNIKFGVTKFKKGAPEAKVGDFVDSELKPFIEEQGLTYLLNVTFKVDQVEFLVNSKKDFKSCTFNKSIEIASFKCDTTKKKANYMKVQLGYFDDFMDIVKDFSITDASITASSGKHGKIKKGTDSVIKYNLN